MRKRVFVSHPYSDSPEDNLNRVTEIIKKLSEVYPDKLFISPLHAFSYFDEEKDTYRDDILDYCKTMIDTCEEVLVAGISSGCLIEADYALRENKEVYIFEKEDMREMGVVGMIDTINDLRERDKIYTYVS